MWRTTIPTTGKYETVTTFTLGQAYWIRSRIAQDQHIPINVDPNNGGYAPLTNQVQPTASAFKATYSQGWNQVGNPYVLPINFSEVQIFDPATLTISSVSDAASPVNQVVLPAVYEYDTTDPDPANWHYVLEPSIGFQMQPFKGLLGVCPQVQPAVPVSPAWTFRACPSAAPPCWAWVSRRNCSPPLLKCWDEAQATTGA